MIEDLDAFLDQVRSQAVEEDTNDLEDMIEALDEVIEILEEVVDSRLNTVEYK